MMLLLIDSPARTLVVIELGGGGGGGGCNRVHLHIVFVLLYVLCVSLCRCSFVCVRQSIFYVWVTCCDLDVTMRRHYK